MFPWNNIKKLIEENPNKTQLSNYIYPNYNDFHKDPNKLEAIVLLTTNHEITSKRYSKFIQSLIAITPTNIKYDIDFVIGIDNDKSNPLDNHVQYLKYIFKNVVIINTNIDDYNNIYTFDKKSVPKVPELGLISGPNILFLETMKQLHDYNTVLLLETDCILYSDWLDMSIQYVKYTGDFLIAGSTYDGTDPISINNTVQFLHINGVGFYKTGSSVFHFILNNLESYIKQKVQNNILLCAYDFMITEMIFSNLQNKNSAAFEFWKVVYRNIIKTTLIINASLKIDTHINDTIFTTRFPRCVILHKKLL